MCITKKLTKSNLCSFKQLNKNEILTDYRSAFRRTVAILFKRSCRSIFGSKCSDYRYFYSDPVHEGKKYDKLLFFYNSNKKEVRHFVKIFQCCGAGAGGAEIILGPRAGAENKF